MSTPKIHDEEWRAVGPAVVLHKLEHRGLWDKERAHCVSVFRKPKLSVN